MTMLSCALVFAEFLEHAGDIQIIAEADDGEMAQHLIQQHLPDVAVLDIQMPKISGIEVTRSGESETSPG